MKVLIIAGYTRSIIIFRGDLIREIVNQGHEVIAAGPETGYEEQIAAIGARFIQLPMQRAKINPLKDFLLINMIRKLIQQENPDLVFSYTIKPVIFGSIAARLAGVKNIYSMVTGLGYVFSANGWKGKFIKTISKVLYYAAIKCCKKVFFQNPDDMKEFINEGLIKNKKCVLVNGSGVNLEKFKPAPLPEKPVFLMICRIIREKGVMEYLNAARIVKKRYPGARFQLLGPFDANPNALTYDDIRPYIEDQSVEYMGETEDVRPFIENCSVYVLPSYYREGTPRTILEAMAMGRPIITTNAPGCRETVIDGENGFLVPIKDVETLAAKMMWMIEHKELSAKMAERSLTICQKKYDVNIINQLILDTLELRNDEISYEKNVVLRDNNGL